MSRVDNRSLPSHPCFRTFGREGGFTLIELMVALTMLAILTTLAMPSFVTMISRARATDVTQQLQSAMTLARSESIKRGRRVSIAPRADTLAPAGSWVNGWNVFVDQNNDGVFDENIEPKLLTQGAWVARFGSGAEALTINISGLTVGSNQVLSYVAGRPQTLAGAPVAFNAHVYHNSAPAYWTLTCVAATGRARTIKPGEQAGMVNGIPTCPGGV